MSVPKRVADRISKNLPTFQRVLEDAKSRDVHESDTVTIVQDVLAGLFGFDKYSEVTSEQCIRGTYCDLAVKLDGSIRYLIEVKAVGLDLKESHLRQIVNYGANHGIPWVVLTNGIVWEIYRIKFEKPISSELTCSFNLLQVSARSKDDRMRLFLLCKEGLSKDAIEAFHEYAQNFNRFVVAAVIQSDAIVAAVRRELRRIVPGVRISTVDIVDMLPDVLKRDAIEGDAAKTARRRIQRAATKASKQRRLRSEDAGDAKVATDDTEKAPSP